MIALLLPFVNSPRIIFRDLERSYADPMALSVAVLGSCLGASQETEDSRPNEVQRPEHDDTITMERIGGPRTMKLGTIRDEFDSESTGSKDNGRPSRCSRGCDRKKRKQTKGRKKGSCGGANPVLGVSSWKLLFLLPQLSAECYPCTLLDHPSRLLS